MEQLFTQNLINITKEQLKKFELYYKLLTEYNEKFNITAITEEKEVYIKHFIDSVKGQTFIKGKNLIDIGAGGGFPSLPLKIMNPEVNLTMVDATEKKCDFLRILVKELELDNVKVIHGRAEELAKDNNYREKFSTCVSRAVARLNILCEYCLPFVEQGGIFLAYKGDADEELAESKNAIKTLGAKLNNVEVFELDGAKRTFITIEKVGNTPIIYPRANGRIRKKPL